MSDKNQQAVPHPDENWGDFKWAYKYPVHLHLRGDDITALKCTFEYGQHACLSLPEDLYPRERESQLRLYRNKVSFPQVYARLAYNEEDATFFSENVAYDRNMYSICVRL